MTAIPAKVVRENAMRVRRAIDRMVRSVSIEHLTAGAMNPVRENSLWLEPRADPAALRLYSFPRGFRQR